MLRVVFETRIDVGGVPTLARLEKRICPQDLHMSEGTIEGYPVINMISITEYHPTTKKASKRPRREVNAALEQSLYARLCLRVAVSRYAILFEPALEDMAKDLEWDLALRNSGYRARPFGEMWLKFKEATLRTFWFSRNTRNMIRRVEREEWLAPHIKLREC